MDKYVFTSRLIILQLFSAPMSFIFSLSVFITYLLFSTKITELAPLLIASMPIVP